VKDGDAPRPKVAAHGAYDRKCNEVGDAACVVFFRYIGSGSGSESESMADRVLGCADDFGRDDKIGETRVTERRGGDAKLHPAVRKLGAPMQVLRR